jgi:hypothetical protein
MAASSAADQGHGLPKVISEGETNHIMEALCCHDNGLNVR